MIFTVDVGRALYVPFSRSSWSLRISSMPYIKNRPTFAFRRTFFAHRFMEAYKASNPIISSSCTLVSCKASPGDSRQSRGAAASGEYCSSVRNGQTWHSAPCTAVLCPTLVTQEPLWACCRPIRGRPIRVDGVPVVHVAAGIHIERVVRVASIRRAQADVPAQ